EPKPYQDGSHRGHVMERLTPDQSTNEQEGQLQQDRTTEMQELLTDSSPGQQSPNSQILNVERLIERAIERIDHLADGLAVLGPKWTRLVELIVEDTGRKAPRSSAGRNIRGGF